MNANGLFVIHAVSTFYLVGLIWMVQIVHYPLMEKVGSEEFARYESDHGRMITPVVAPVMIVELVTGLLLAFGLGPTWISPSASWIGFSAIAAIWGSTFFLQVPYHSILLNGFDADAHRGLVVTNWIRTILWTGRGILVAFLLWRALQASTVVRLDL
jgi:uncharacterized membrane protein